MSAEPIAYTYEADTHCPACALARFGRTADGFIASEDADGEPCRDAEGNGVGAVFGWDEWHSHAEPDTEPPYVLACGTCHAEIERCDEPNVPSAWEVAP